MNNANQTLVKMMAEHPDAEVICMVAYEVVPDDSYSRWTGEIIGCRLTKVAEYRDELFEENEIEEFKNYYYDYNFDELCQKFGYEPNKDTKKNKKAEAEIEGYLEGVVSKAFKEVILVDINPWTGFEGE